MKNINITINFDMDGTIADLYGVENWLPMIRAYDATPYREAKPLLNLSALARQLNAAQRKGAKLVIISWASKDPDPGFFDDVLWEALYAASLSPSYLNRQAYGFVIHDSFISLVQAPDDYNTKIDGDLSLGIVLHHFSTVAEEWAGKLTWRNRPESESCE